LGKKFYKRVNVKGHYRHYYVCDGKGGYKRVRRYISPHQRRVQTVTYITQPAKVKKQLIRAGYDSDDVKVMSKDVPKNLIEGIKTIAKDQDNEYSVAIDFERKKKRPEQMLVMKGGKNTTLKIRDFELFGHTHPGHYFPYPSMVDISNMRPLYPEFIVAGKSGHAVILNIEDFDKFREWVFDYRTSSEADRKKPELFLPRNVERIFDWEKAREDFFRKTGVRVYPLKKRVKIQLKNDPDPERPKTIPYVPRYLLYKWHGSEKEVKK